MNILYMLNFIIFINNHLNNIIHIEINLFENKSLLHMKYIHIDFYILNMDINKVDILYIHFYLQMFHLDNLNNIYYHRDNNLIDMINILLKKYMLNIKMDKINKLFIDSFDYTQYKFQMDIQ
jgi:hypothetical protein